MVLRGRHHIVTASALRQRSTQTAGCSRPSRSQERKALEKGAYSNAQPAKTKFASSTKLFKHSHSGVGAFHNPHASKKVPSPLVRQVILLGQHQPACTLVTLRGINHTVEPAALFRLDSANSTHRPTQASNRQEQQTRKKGCRQPRLEQKPQRRNSAKKPRTDAPSLLPKLEN